MYELISGRCPFEGESLPVVCARVLSAAEAAPLDELAPPVPPELAALIARCLRKERAERFASVAELASALVPFASAERQRAAARRSLAALGASAQLGAVRLKSDRPTVTPLLLATGAGGQPGAQPYVPVLAAALLLLAGGLGWSALHAPSARPDAAASAAREPEPSALALPVATASVGLTAAPVVPTAAAASAGPPRAPRALRRAVAPAATVSALPSATVVPERPVAQPPGDAWDPDRLGGRY